MTKVEFCYGIIFINSVAPDWYSLKTDLFTYKVSNHYFLSLFIYLVLSETLAAWHEKAVTMKEFDQLSIVQKIEKLYEILSDSDTPESTDELLNYCAVCKEVTFL